jgi:acylphosphatase
VSGDAGDRAAEQRLEARIHGRVQGVGFRVFVLRVARELGLRGWVANEPGRQVHVVAEGPLDRLAELVLALRAGPPAALVERVDEAWLPAIGDVPSFEIRSGWHGGD